MNSPNELPEQTPPIRDGSPVGTPTAVAIVRGLAGAIAGAVAGYFATKWLAGQGLYAIVMPGALAGLGCGYLSRIRSYLLGAICLVIGLLACSVTEALLWPFVADESLIFFFKNLGENSNGTLLLIAIGGAMGGWFGVGRHR